MLAAANNHKEMAELLIRNGAHVNALSNGMTALMFAVDSGHLNIVTFLIQNGADINIQVSVCLNRICFSNMAIHHVILLQIQN
jgi:ankyrin repeat protein